MKERVRIIRFILIGTLNAVITALVIWVMMGLLQCNYILSNIVAYSAALVNNFFWSKYWIFGSKGGRFVREVPLFLIAFGCAYISQFLFVLLLVEIFRMDAYLAQFFGLFIYGAVNFVMNREVTFKSR